MAEANPGVSDSATEGGADGEQKKDSVAYDTYRRAIGEVKSLKAKLQEIATKETEREQALLTEQGKYKESLDLSLKKQKELEDKLNKQTKSFATQLFSKEAKSVALQLGARQEALDDIIKVGDWNEVEIDENFNINSDSLKNSMTKLMQSKPFYFQRAQGSVKDIQTSASGAVGGGKQISEMSQQEIEAQLRKMK